ncbi:RING finger protein 151 [Lonchura striata]|uniref:E3 ubiquitin-protein ligase NRDP1 n=1 Tax=Lonchura striata TaxID=40157 RepID=A0A218V5S0_9PASE|nr:RING finger protein 151 [Lonchura striata domestica]XP_021398891.1 RING finger protein 151 [Lonchura striata domestica]XP_021398892.1 RING finger protein 151 [Lonchura striata domestica]OWK61455.1 E3 ubiquitin-protein ligase NRDP1 [Lonchura striata domestica]
MGYDIERFVGYVNEGLLCSICRDVLEDPLQAPCEHAFCSACIHGWLVHHSNCPEDRQVIDVSLLRPLYRYMKNDLNRLQLHCRNREYGCEMVCSLESIDRHEKECEYSQIPCSNAGCTVQIERRNLDGHLAVCEYRSRECPNGCGYTVLSAEDTQHNCVAELRTELELLRSEIICRVEEAKHEMESRLDSQRRHMVQKESILQNEIEELKSQMSRMMSDVRSLVAAERRHRQELEQAELEKRELMELLKGLQKDCRLTTTEGSRKSNFRPLTRLESFVDEWLQERGHDYLQLVKQ